VTGYGLEGLGSIPGRARDLFIIRSIQAGSGAHPAAYPMGTWGPFPGVKRPERKADHSSPSSADVKNGEVVPSLPHIFLWRNA
jgi:hypothetical protein